MQFISYWRQGPTTGKAETFEHTVDQDNFQEDIEDVEEQPLVRHHSRHVRNIYTEEPEEMQRADNPPPNPLPRNSQMGRQDNRGFPSEEVLSSHHASRELYIVQTVAASQLTVLLPFHCKVGWHFVRRA
jgi:hypothetical protein